jgi:3-oxoacyl-(acyl-carrier-protein) synthase
MARVVVTGVGVISAAGVSRTPSLRLLSTASAQFTFRTFRARDGFPELGTVYGAHIGDFPVTEFLGTRGVRTLNRESRILMSAAVLACRDAGLDLEQLSGESVGVAAGTSFSGLNDYMELFIDGLTLGADRVNPSQGPQTGYNAPPSQLSIFLKASGPNLTISSGYASGIDATSYGAHFIRHARTRVVLAGGVETLSYFTIYAERMADDGFGRVRSLRPYDRRRTGTIPGEAAGILVLEDAKSAEGREVSPLAEVVGAGSAFASAKPGAGSEEAARRAIEQALAASKCDPSDIDAVVASGNGSPGLDATEARALYGVFGEGVDVCSVKGAVGESRAASGAVQAAVAALALKEGLLPPTIGFEELDSHLPPLRITKEAVDRPLRRIMVHSLDPAGYAAAIVLGSMVT